MENIALKEHRSLVRVALMACETCQAAKGVVGWRLRVPACQDRSCIHQGRRQGRGGGPPPGERLLHRGPHITVAVGWGAHSAHMHGGPQEVQPIIAKMKPR